MQSGCAATAAVPSKRPHVFWQLVPSKEQHFEAATNSKQHQTVCAASKHVRCTASAKPVCSAMQGPQDGKRCKHTIKTRTFTAAQAAGNAQCLNGAICMFQTHMCLRQSMHRTSGNRKMTSCKYPKGRCRSGPHSNCKHSTTATACVTPRFKPNMQDLDVFESIWLEGPSEQGPQETRLLFDRVLSCMQM